MARKVGVTKRTPRIRWCSTEDPSSNSSGIRSASGGGVGGYRDSSAAGGRCVDILSDTTGVAAKSHIEESVAPTGVSLEGTNGLGTLDTISSSKPSQDSLAPRLNGLSSGAASWFMYPLAEILRLAAMITNSDVNECRGTLAYGGTNSDSLEGRRVQTRGEEQQANTAVKQNSASQTTASVECSTGESGSDNPVLPGPTPVPKAATGLHVASRVPLAWVTSISWTLPATELTTPGFRWLDGVSDLQFGDCSVDNVLDVASVETVEVFTVAECSVSPLEMGGVPLPPGLKSPHLGKGWNMQLHSARELASLQTFFFQPHFNTLLSGDGVALPWSVREIELGSAFNQPLVGVEWPLLLEKIAFSCCFDQSLEGVQFPTKLREIYFGDCFAREIAGVVWPKGLQVLMFGRDFNQLLVSPGAEEGAPLGRTHLLPAGLHNLELGERFNRPLSGSELPDGLEVLRLGCMFDYVSSVLWPSRLKRLHLNFLCGTDRLDGEDVVGHPLAIVLPPRLESLVVGKFFNSPLTTFAFPSTLKVLDLGYLFNYPIGGQDGDAPLLPDGLEELRLSVRFNRSFDDTRLPVGLKRRIMPKQCVFNQSLAGVVWPPGLEELNLGGRFNQPMEGTIFPETLRELSFCRSFICPLQSVDLPHGLTRLSFSGDFAAGHALQLHWPRSLRNLHINSSRLSCQEDLTRWLAVRQQCLMLTTMVSTCHVYH